MNQYDHLLPPEGEPEKPLPPLVPESQLPVVSIRARRDLGTRLAVANCFIHAAFHASYGNFPLAVFAVGVGAAALIEKGEQS